MVAAAAVDTAAAEVVIVGRIHQYANRSFQLLQLIKR
jgi:phosphotransacetylase